MGQTMGGRVGMILALSQPHLFDKLICVDSTPRQVPILLNGAINLYSSIFLAQYAYRVTIVVWLYVTNTLFRTNVKTIPALNGVLVPNHHGHPVFYVGITIAGSTSGSGIKALVN